MSFDIDSSDIRTHVNEVKLLLRHSGLDPVIAANLLPERECGRSQRLGNGQINKLSSHGLQAFVSENKLVRCFKTLIQRLTIASEAMAEPNSIPFARIGKDFFTHPLRLRSWGSEAVVAIGGGSLRLDWRGSPTPLGGC